MNSIFGVHVDKCFDHLEYKESDLLLVDFALWHPLQEFEQVQIHELKNQEHLGVVVETAQHLDYVGVALH